MTKETTPTNFCEHGVPTGQECFGCGMLESNTNLTTQEIQTINSRIAQLQLKADTGEQHADICFLAGLLSNGPWFNGMTQDKAISLFRGWMTVEA